MKERHRGTKMQGHQGVAFGGVGWAVILLFFWVVEVRLNAEEPTTGEMEPVAGPGGEVNSADNEVKGRGGLYAWALAVVLGGLFIVLLMMAMARSGRFFRRRHRIGVKEKPTEHIDAWSQSRLKDSDWDDPDEDEK